MKISSEYHLTRNGRFKKNPKRAGGSDYLTIQRIPSNVKNATMKEGADYWLNGSEPMTIEDWRKYARKNNYYGLRIYENGGFRFEKW